ncbi:MAG TPA: TetR/AcrR family transcriptional regulator [Candidatus Dormibacteraeota bacterium]|nr:TetR/AcrR family transcriptional regulator [Candidatus Dormibacteraeota bacterium]
MLNDRSTKPETTRERILQAAFTVLSRQGYENASIKDIAEEAEVAQGLVHYHFKSKQLLVLAVLQYVCQTLELAPMEGESGARQAFEHTKAMLRENRDTHSLYIQLIGVGLHDEVIGAGVRDFIRGDRQKVEDIARTVLAERALSAGPARGIAGVVWAAILGIMVQALVDPEFNADEAIDALAAMSLSAVYTGAQTGV